MNNKEIGSKDFDLGVYFDDRRKSFKESLESNPEMWEMWTKSDKRYMLVTNISCRDNDFEKDCGKVTATFDANISSNSLDDLQNIWENVFSKRYCTTTQNFIVDMKEKKVIVFLSCCF